MDGGGGTPRHVLLTGAKQSHLGCLISFKSPMGFQNFVVINKIHPLKKTPYRDMVMSGVSIRANPNLNIYGVKFDSKLTCEGHVRGIVSFVLGELVL